MGGAALGPRPAQDFRPVAGQKLRFEKGVGGAFVQFAEAAFDPGLVGQFHDPGQALQKAQGAESQRLDVGLLQQFQGKGDEDAARRRRRVGIELGAPVTDRQGPTLFDPVAFEVAPCQSAAAGLAIVGDAGRDVAPVEQVLAFPGQRLQGVGEIGVGHGFALALEVFGVLGAGEYGAAGGSRQIDRADDLKQVGLQSIDSETLARQGHRRLDKARHRQGA